MIEQGTPSHVSNTTPAPDSPSPRPLRVLIGCDTFSPDVNGAARFAERLAAGMVRLGHDVHVVAPSQSRRKIGTFTETIEGEPMTLHRWASWRWYPHDWLRFVIPWTARPRARALLDAVQPDVVHVQSHVIIGRGLAIEAAARGIRVIATNHLMPENVLDFTLLPEKLEGWFIRKAWAAAERVLVLAERVTTPTRRAAEFLEQNTVLRDVLPVSCGIDAANYTADLGPREVPRVIFVGRLTAEKQIDVILRAMTRLDPAIGAHLDLVGGGDQKKNLEALARELGIADRVSFHGRVSDERLRELYSRATVFTIASIAELQSIATMEAMASGLPILAADAMALPHLVHVGENGFLFEPGNDAQLAEQLTTVLTAPEEQRVAWQRASLDAVRVHDIARTLRTFEALYRGETPEA